MIEWHSKSTAKQGIIYFFVHPALGILVVLTVLTQFWRAHPPNSVFWRGAAAGALMGLMLGINELYQSCIVKGKEVRSLWARDLAGGSVEVSLFMVTTAARIMSPKGNLTGYFIDIGMQRLLFLKGRYFNGMNDIFVSPQDDTLGHYTLRAGCHPTCHITVERLPHSKYVLQVQRHAGQLEVVRTIFSRRAGSGNLKRFYRPVDGEIVSGTLMTLEEDLYRLQARRVEQTKGRKNDLPTSPPPDPTTANR